VEHIIKLKFKQHYNNKLWAKKNLPAP